MILFFAFLARRESLLAKAIEHRLIHSLRLQEQRGRGAPGGETEGCQRFGGYRRRRRSAVEALELAWL